jgi:choline transport protein
MPRLLTKPIQAASRLTWSFARDNALIGSKYIGRMHSNLEAPVWALVANGFVIFIIGCIYLASSTAFNAFIGTGLILQQATFAIPAAVLMFRKRSSDILPPHRLFKLWGPIGWIANFLTMAFAIIVVIFYDFPVIMPAQASNMSESKSFIVTAELC